MSIRKHLWHPRYLLVGGSARPLRGQSAGSDIGGATNAEAEKQPLGTQVWSASKTRIPTIRHRSVPNKLGSTGKPRQCVSLPALSVVRDSFACANQMEVTKLSRKPIASQQIGRLFEMGNFEPHLRSPPRPASGMAGYRCCSEYN